MECNPETVTPELARGAGGARPARVARRAVVPGAAARRAGAAGHAGRRRGGRHDPARGRRREPLARPHPRHPGPGPRAARRRPRPADRARSPTTARCTSSRRSPARASPTRTAPSWRVRASCSRSTTSASSSGSRVPATRWYESANFARPGRESAHNRAYWLGRDYLGIGVGAVSTLGDRAPRQRARAWPATWTRSRPASRRRPGSRSCPRRHEAAGAADARAAPRRGRRAGRRWTTRSIPRRSRCWSRTASSWSATVESSSSGGDVCSSTTSSPASFAMTDAPDTPLTAPPGAAAVPRGRGAHRLRHRRSARRRSPRRGSSGSRRR